MMSNLLLNWTLDSPVLYRFLVVREEGGLRQTADPAFAQQ